MNHWRLKEMFLWVLVILLLEYNTVCFSCMEEERNGLLKLKTFLRKPYALGNNSKPDPILSWVDDENSDCCGWELVKCGNYTGRVAQLDLQGEYANGSDLGLDASLFLHFQQLQHLDLSWNGFSSLHNHQDLGMLKELELLVLGYNAFNNSILQSLSALTSLTVLDLSSNLMSGSLSDFGRGLCEMKNLQELDLSKNYLSGSIPSYFNNLTSLKVLDLSDNQFGGNLHPSFLSSLASLEYLSLNSNLQFEGNLMITSLVSHESQFVFLGLSNCNLNISTNELARILANQHNLMEIDLSHNNLHGEFPNWLVEKNSKLTVLILRNNSLVGHIHFQVGPLVNLEWFDVSNNHIQGELQPNIGEILSQLDYLNISSNELGGGIPTSIHHMKYLNTLDLSNNNLSGKLPERLDLSCQYLGLILLSNNKLEGQISHTLFNLTGLSALDLSNNQFTGDIPSYNSQSFDLVSFDISQNHISGRIPPWLGNLTILNTLAMQNNSIEGYIPPEFCNSTYLEYLDLSQNQLSGPVPSCLVTIPSLKYLHLQRNKLKGPLPKPSLKSSELFTLDLKHNNLSGEIPSWFGSLLNLRVLLLKGNHFSGSIPRELCLLNMIGIMDLSHNNLSGSIPSCFTNITFGRFAVVGVNPAFYPITTSGSTASTATYTFPSPVPREKSFVSRNYEQETSSEEVEFMMKSRTNSYKGEIITFMSGMDLSCNNLKGKIPLDIGALTEIRTLNLSYNRITGLIPKSLANLKQIESIDLSHNKLSGGIPSNLTSLYTLVVFNVAYNNLSGRVPEMVAQFSTFGETSYEGNPFLCGPPLLGKQCNVKTNQATKTDTLVGQNDIFGIDPLSFLASFAAAYVTYLLGFVIVLYINPYWRRRWFRFIDACLSFVFPFCSEAIYRREIRAIT